MDRDSVWTRRSNASRPSLPSQSSFDRKTDSQTRPFPSKRYVSGDQSSSGRSQAANGVPPVNTNVPLSTGASSAFGLGSGAFAAFGASAKTPKTPATAGADIPKSSSSSTSPPLSTEAAAGDKASKSGVKSPTASASKEILAGAAEGKAWPLRYTWVMWYRPPASKNQDYEKSIKPMYKLSTAQEFWKIYAHLKHPSALPVVSDYHFFKDGIRPVWEDEENKRGGKWILKLKKGVMDRYWDDLLLAVIGDQFAEAGEEVCGMVVSVRHGEDVLSVWTKNDGGRNVKIRETIKRVLGLPVETVIVWKSHDDSIAQRSAIDQARQEKGTTERRRNTLNENPQATKEKADA